MVEEGEGDVSGRSKRLLALTLLLAWLTKPNSTDPNQATILGPIAKPKPLANWITTIFGHVPI
jgi:hypothetical protein